MIRRAWRAMWFMDDDDRTPQGKLAHGCFYLIYIVIAMVMLAGIAETLSKAFH